MRSALRLAIASRTPWPQLFQVECSQPPLGGEGNPSSISAPGADPFHLQLPLSDLLENPRPPGRDCLDPLPVC